ITAKNYNGKVMNCNSQYPVASISLKLEVPIKMHDFLMGGFTANTSLAHCCQDNDLVLHIHRTIHAIIDRKKNHVALEACVQASNEGCDLVVEGNAIIREASKWSPELAM
ncbi:hypothetical protein Pfo_021822, partial [Paulownia fortunei]